MRRELPMLGQAPPSPSHPGEDGSGPALTRRQLIQLAAVSAGAVAFTGCKPAEPETTAQSRARLAEDIVAGYDSWYATACPGCGAGCGAIIRVMAGRAKKLEGNPVHPVSLGRSCARAQAVVQEEYLPDRLTGPMLRTGPRGSNAFLPISWDDALSRMIGQLRQLRDQGQAAQLAVLTPPRDGPQARLLTGFVEGFGGSWLRLDPLSEAPAYEAARRVFGADRMPAFDIANARFLLSFGADFLSTWLSPVYYGYQYGVFRQGRYEADQFEPRPDTRPRGFMTHVEPRMSMTAANADEWIWIRPGREGLLARSLAQVILSDGLASPDGARAFDDASTLDEYAPERVAQETGITAERIRTLARRFATEQPSLALGGSTSAAHTNGTDTLTAVLALNVLVGNVGRPGGVLLNPPPPLPEFQPSVAASTLAEWQDLAERLRVGQVQAVLVHDANPIYSLPAQVGMADALQQAPFIVSFSSLMDETTAQADLILPSHLPLEEWGMTVPSPAPAQPVVTLQQPVVRPLYDTRSFWDTLLQTAEQLGGPVREATPWTSFRDLLRATVRDFAQRVAPAPISEVEAERFWTQALQRGGYWPETSPAGQPAPPQPSSPGAAGSVAAWRPPSFAGDEGAYPFHLVVFSQNTLADGRTAHIPWLQATPDPLTTVAWQTWVEINPRVAERLSLREGNIVDVETPAGRIDLPVYISPAAPPDVLSVPLGQGRAASGRWAEGRGANPLAILAPLVDEATGTLASAATRARLVLTGRRMQLPKLEGTVPARQLEEEPVLRITREA